VVVVVVVEEEEEEEEEEEQSAQPMLNNHNSCTPCRAANPLEDLRYLQVHRAKHPEHSTRLLHK
jgi:hypothetical protein